MYSLKIENNFRGQSQGQVCGNCKQSKPLLPSFEETNSKGQRYLVALCKQCYHQYLDHQIETSEVHTPAEKESGSGEGRSKITRKTHRRHRKARGISSQQKEKLESLKATNPLAKLRLERGLTQIQMARLSKVSKSSIAHLETNYGKASPRLLAKIADALELDLTLLENMKLRRASLENMKLRRASREQALSSKRKLESLKATNPLAKLRLERGLTQIQMARLSKVSRGTIGYLETNSRKAKPKIIAKLAEALEVDLTLLESMMLKRGGAGEKPGKTRNTKNNAII